MVCEKKVGEAFGRDVWEYTLSNGTMEVSFFSYGGIIHRILAPDAGGNLADVVRGFDDFAAYLQPNPYFGALVGRCCNRIGGAAFVLNGERSCLTKNSGENQLHGGSRGFNSCLWQPVSKEDCAVTLAYESEDGEEGYPGKLSVSVRYALSSDHRLSLTYTALSDKDTLANFTNHSYFNLAGSGSILRHRFQTPARRFCPVDEKLLPTGALRFTADTPFDFANPRSFEENLAVGDEQTALAGGGYDHHFVLDGHGLRRAAALQEPVSGRCLTVFTTLPGFQLYTAQGCDTPGKQGQRNGGSCGVCIETQYPPNAVNIPGWEAPIARKGVPFRSQTDYAFGVL